jgi:cell division septation protein DedD
VGTTSVSPSVAAAREAVAQASQATGTESPAEAGASYARPAPARSETQVAAARPGPVPARAPAAAASGPWQVQLGAFAVDGNAEKLWARLSGRSELAGRQRLLVPAGRVTKLLAAGYPTRTAADAACRSLKQSGQDCLVTR